MEYKTTEASPHGRAEELQWAHILSSGDPAKGMVLVLGQKMCTAFHEFEPAWRAGALNDQRLSFFRERISKRIQRVLITMRNNGLDSIAGYTELEELGRATEAAEAMDDLARLEEKAHAISHTIGDSLEVGCV